MLMGQDRAIGHLAQRQIVHRVHGNRPTALGRRRSTIAIGFCWFHARRWRKAQVQKPRRPTKNGSIQDGTIPGIRRRGIFWCGSGCDPGGGGWLNPGCCDEARIAGISNGQRRMGGYRLQEAFRISRTKERDKSPALDRMLKDANRRRFDVAMAWSIDRVGRSLTDLLATIQHLEAVRVDLYLGISSTSTPRRRQAACSTR